MKDPEPSHEDGAVDRREFVRSSAAAIAAAAIGPSDASSKTREKGDVVSAQTSQARRQFRLRYAPHFGMFSQHSGEDLVAQLEFMRAEGFTALEDNDLKRRSVADQERIGRTLDRLGMRMGVFVAHTIAWNEANQIGRASCRERV